MKRIMVDASDLGKLFDTVEAAYRHHCARDTMNAILHLARETRLSPLTSELGAACDRLKAILERAAAVPSEGET